jgi:hypothetical protein
LALLVLVLPPALILLPVLVQTIASKLWLARASSLPLILVLVSVPVLTATLAPAMLALVSVLVPAPVPAPVLVLVLVLALRPYVFIGDIPVLVLVLVRPYIISFCTGNIHVSSPYTNIGILTIMLMSPINTSCSTLWLCGWGLPWDFGGYQ